MIDPRPVEPRPQDGVADVGSLVALGVEELPPTPEPVPLPDPVEPG